MTRAWTQLMGAIGLAGTALLAGSQNSPRVGMLEQDAWAAINAGKAKAAAELFREARAKQEAANGDTSKRKPVVVEPPPPKYKEKPAELYEAVEAKVAEEPRRGPGRPGRRLRTSPAPKRRGSRAR